MIPPWEYVDLDFSNPCEFYLDPPNLPQAKWYHVPFGIVAVGVGVGGLRHARVYDSTDSCCAGFSEYMWVPWKVDLL